ncbi:MAG: Jag N-terminal domain-containing protein [Coprobacillus sp.]|nr:Jag N-terminal domain-containing protein [Coprobacillus sp.]
MTSYTGKTLEEALESAASELGLDVNDLLYISSESKGPLGRKRITVEVYDLSEVIEYAENYILNVIDSFGIESSVKTVIRDDIITITIDSIHNPILIGKNGKTLQALNELTNAVVSKRFHHHFRILLDVNGYKSGKYKRLEKVARSLAFKVRKTHETYTFDEMPSDERRVIHNAVNDIKGVKSVSTGEGAHRRVQLIYDPESNEKKS